MSALKKPILVSESDDLLEIIKECDFFKKFPPNHYQSLQNITEVCRFGPDTKLVTQGEVNDSVYFLMSGVIGIYINGKLASKLQRKGDLVGEMDLVSQRPSSATIKVETESELIKIPVASIRNLPFEGQEYFEQNLYRFFAIMLTQKLDSSKDRVNSYELVVRQLQEAQYLLEEGNKKLEEKVKRRTQELSQKNAILKIGNEKLKELYRQRDVTLQRLVNLYRHHLIPLKDTVNDLYEKSDETLKRDVAKVERVLEEVMDVLKPLANLHEKDQELKTQKVLVVERSKRSQAEIKMALGGTGIDLTCVEIDTEAKELMESHAYDLLITSLEQLPLSEYAIKKNPALKVILITTENKTTYFNDLVRYPFITNIVSRNISERSFVVKNILTTVNKIAQKDIFGLEKYLSWGAEISAAKVEASDQRKSIIAKMDEYFKDLGIRQTHRSRVRSVAEEMLMNLIYDAPVEKGTEKYNHLSREQVVKLKPHEVGEFRYGQDGLWLGISAIDHFGSLERQTILNYLDSCSKGKYGRFQMGKGGAGMGLFQILSTSDLVVFNVRPGRKTEVIALFSLDQSKLTEGHHPSFHYFSE